jgi:hypothetical protein
MALGIALAEGRRQDGVELAGVVRDWVRGVPALDGIDVRAFLSEVPEHEWQQVSERTRAHRGGRLGTYRDRQQAKALAATAKRAAEGDSEAQALVDVLNAQFPDWRETLGAADA